VSPRRTGIWAALASSFFLGFSPIFGRQAILAGLSPWAVVAVRTLLAALIVFLAILLTQRRYLYIYPAGLLGCLLAGGINGLGSLLFYGSLARINASVGQLLNSTYPIFVALWLTLDRQPPTRLTMVRLLLSLPAIYLLTQTNGSSLDLVGVLMMLGAAAMYALHLPINQRVLYEMPAQTVTLYTLTAMSLVVVPAYFLIQGVEVIPDFRSAGWWPVLGLTTVTLFSRLTLFTGVKHLGGMQTAIIGLFELIVTVVIANLWLGEQLSTLQWTGAAILMGVVFLVAFDRGGPQNLRPGGWLRWLTPPTPEIDLSQSR
jgi:drug/metabolite transporter (DMT)-like permease